MAKAHDTYIVPLKDAHLDWGRYRRTDSRDSIEGEGYIQIPKDKAKEFCIYNSNYYINGFGYNKFYANSVDGFLKNVVLLAQGNNEKGDIYAKQFSVEGDLKKIGSWYKYMEATTANSVKVTWTENDTVLLEIV